MGTRYYLSKCTPQHVGFEIACSKAAATISMSNTLPYPTRSYYYSSSKAISIDDINGASGAVKAAYD